MKNFCFAFFLVVVAVASGDSDFYPDEFDHIDIDEVLSSKRLVDNYLFCFKTGLKCTPDGQKLRDIFPDALKTKCSRCSESQKAKATKILEWVIANRPDDFLDLENDFDPEHVYRHEYADILKERDIVLPALKN